MPRTGLLPESVKALLRPAWHRCRARLPALAHRHKSLHKTHAYWRNPPDEANAPGHYLHRVDRSRFLLELIERYAAPGASILEIGCNAGRNLHALYANGWTNLTGVDISEPALALLSQVYPAMADEIALINAPMEDVVRIFRPGQFDVTYTMAVLEHVHTRSEWVFAEMARITRSYVITIEDECGRSWRHFPRNYREVFEALGCTQIQSVDFRETQSRVFSPGFRARVFLPPPSPAGE